MSRKILLVIAATGLLSMAGCGGGGASGPTYDLDAIATKYAETKHSYTLYTVFNSSQLMAQVNEAPGPTPTVCDSSAKTTTTTIDFFDYSLSRSPIRSESTTRYYGVNPYTPICDYYSGTGFITVYSSTTNLPTAASVGDSGSLDTGTTYYDTGLKTVFGTKTGTWTLQSDTEGNAVFCEKTAFDPANASSFASYETACYTLDTNSNVVNLTLTEWDALSGFTVTYLP